MDFSKYGSVYDMTRKDFAIGIYGNGVCQLTEKATGAHCYSWSEPALNAYHFPPVDTYEEALEHVNQS